MQVRQPAAAVNNRYAFGPIQNVDDARPWLVPEVPGAGGNISRLYD